MKRPATQPLRGRRALDPALTHGGGGGRSRGLGDTVEQTPSRSPGPSTRWQEPTWPTARAASAAACASTTCFPTAAGSQNPRHSSERVRIQKVGVRLEQERAPVRVTDPADSATTTPPVIGLVGIDKNTGTIGSIDYMCPFENGLYTAITGAGADITFIYE